MEPLGDKINRFYLHGRNMLKSETLYRAKNRMASPES